MSDTILSALMSSVFGLIGVIVGSCITIRKLRHERSDKYLLAALELKLKAHQDAFNLSWDLPSAAHKSSTDVEYLNKCEKWYRENCLYLEIEAREAFFKAYITASIYYMYLDEWRETKDSKELKDRWRDIVNAKNIIERNVTKPLIVPPDLKKDEYDYEGKIENKKQ